MNYKEYISVNPEVMVGKPCIKGTRITVELIVERLAEGETIEQLLEAYPHLNKEKILAAKQYAVHVLKNDLIFPVSI